MKRTSALDPEDVAHCRELLRRGSKSFDAAARALPARLVDRVAVLYAFCRVSDDLVDESKDSAAALAELMERLEAIYASRPSASPVDRALSVVVAEASLPRAPLDALIDGYRWDAEGRTYATLSELFGYCARVAASVGVAMTYLMEVREPFVLARAIDLGTAMQLTNIARDVGEDARRGRVYLPTRWVPGVSPLDLKLTPEVRLATRRLVDHAEVLYERALTGIPFLPSDARTAIRTAAYLYREIGRLVRGAGDDGITERRSTSSARKLVLAAQAALDERFARRTPIHDPVLPEAAFLLG